MALTDRQKSDLLTAGTGAAIGGTAGAVYSANKPGLTKKTRISNKDIQQFIKKLKPGDVLLEGDYKTDSWSKGFQAILRRNKPEYHSTIYTGNGEYAELLIKDTKPSRNTINKSLPFALRHGSHEAYRPKLTKQESRGIGRKINAEFPKMTYDYKDAARVWAQRKVGLKNLSCSGKFCSNSVSSVLPERLFPKQHPSTVMPADFAKNPNFEFVGRLRPYNIHMPFSNKALAKYVAAPALAAGALALGVRKLTQKDPNMTKKAQAVFEKIAISYDKVMKGFKSRAKLYGEPYLQWYRVPKGTNIGQVPRGKEHDIVRFAVGKANKYAPKNMADTSKIEGQIAINVESDPVRLLTDAREQLAMGKGMVSAGYKREGNEYQRKALNNIRTIKRNYTRINKTRDY